MCTRCRTKWKRTLSAIHLLDFRWNSFEAAASSQLEKRASNDVQTIDRIIPKILSRSARAIENYVVNQIVLPTRLTWEISNFFFVYALIRWKCAAFSHLFAAMCPSADDMLQFMLKNSQVDTCFLTIIKRQKSRWWTELMQNNCGRQQITLNALHTIHHFRTKLCHSGMSTVHSSPRLWTHYKLRRKVQWNRTPRNKKNAGHNYYVFGKLQRPECVSLCTYVASVERAVIDSSPKPFQMPASINAVVCLVCVCTQCDHRGRDWLSSRHGISTNQVHADSWRSSRSQTRTTETDCVRRIASDNRMSTIVSWSRVFCLKHGSCHTKCP